LGPGEFIHQRASAPQTERVTSTEEARVLEATRPRDASRFVAVIGRPAESLSLPPPTHSPPDLEQVAAIAAGHGIELLGPPGALPLGPLGTEVILQSSELVAAVNCRVTGSQRPRFLYLPEGPPDNDRRLSGLRRQVIWLGDSRSKTLRNEVIGQH
jgi:hypothetical protein